MSGPVNSPSQVQKRNNSRRAEMIWAGISGASWLDNDGCTGFNITSSDTQVLRGLLAILALGYSSFFVADLCKQ